MKKYILNLSETFTAQEALLLNDEIVKHNGKEINRFTDGDGNDPAFVYVNIIGYSRTVPASWVLELSNDYGFAVWSDSNTPEPPNLLNKTTREAYNCFFDIIESERKKAWLASRRKLYCELENLGFLEKIPF